MARRHPLRRGSAEPVTEQNGVNTIDGVDPRLKFPAQPARVRVFAELKKFRVDRLLRMRDQILELTPEHIAGKQFQIHGNSSPSM